MEKILKTKFGKLHFYRQNAVWRAMTLEIDASASLMVTYHGKETIFACPNSGRSINISENTWIILLKLINGEVKQDKIYFDFDGYEGEVRRRERRIRNTKKRLEEKPL